MKRLAALTLGLLMISASWADGNNEYLLNRVIVPLHAEQWLTTKSALVNVSVSAAVADKGIEKVRGNVIEKLQQIAKGEWHILSFNRQQDPSGLESIQVTAQARLDQTELSGLRDKAKTISKAGETYTISSIDFTPSDDEVKAANLALRSNIYQQVKAEVDALNVLYPTQKYYVHKIDFVSQSPMPMAMMQKNMAYAASEADSAVPSVPIGSKAMLSATVEIASMTDQAAKP